MQQFTPRAQQVLALARKEAQNFRHNYIGTEHILLGIIKLGQGVAVNVLRKMGVNLENASASRKFSRSPLTRRASFATTTSAPSTYFSDSCARARGLPPPCCASSA